MPRVGGIEKLATEVINRIAAGEVVQRPSAALKELIENSLDAGATSIQVLVREGGLDMLQVTDDGCGITYEDLPMLCERYATSKIRKFEDLHTISSFGFRGEALAALSFVSRVTVITKYRSSSDSHVEQISSAVRGVSSQGDRDFAWKCCYSDGRLIDSPEPCAGNHGTTIRAEGMFYNATVRRSALRPMEEWSRLVNIVSRYALAFPTVGFSCRREGASKSGEGVSFPKCSSTLNNIRLSHGNCIVSNLHFIFYYDNEVYEASKKMTKPLCKHSSGSDSSGDMPVGKSSAIARGDFPSVSTEKASLTNVENKKQENADRVERLVELSKYVISLSGPFGEGVFTIRGYTSDSNLLSRKGYFCLFVNQRLVESGAIRRAVESVYSSVLTGGHRPFTVLFVSVPADRVDVNVHPSKTEVYLLDEELVIARIVELTRVALLEAASQRQIDLLSLGKTTTIALQAAARITGGNGKQEGTFATTSSSQAALHAIQTDTQKSRALLDILESSVSQRSMNVPGMAEAKITPTAPCTMARVEQQKGALDLFVRSQPTSDFARPCGQGRAITDECPLDKTRPLLDVQSQALEIATSSDCDPASAVAISACSPNIPNHDILEPCSLVEHFNFLTSSNISMYNKEQVISGSVESNQRQTTNDYSPMLMSESEYKDNDDDLPSNEVMVEFKKYRQDLANQGMQKIDSESFSPTQDELPSHQEQLGLLKKELGPEGYIHTNHEKNSFFLASKKSYLDAATHMDVGQKKSCISSELNDKTMNSGEDINQSDLVDEEALIATDSHVLIAPELEDHVLTSVSSIVREIYSQSSCAAQDLFQGLSFIGTVDADCFLAQHDTTLLLVRTLPLVREVVYQRIFLRWAQSSLPSSPLISFAKPISVKQALSFALCHDTMHMVPPSAGLLELLRLCVINKPGPLDGSVGGIEKSTAEWLELIERVCASELNSTIAPLENPGLVLAYTASMVRTGQRPSQHRGITDKPIQECSRSKVDLEQLMIAAPFLMRSSAQAKLSTEDYISRLVRRLSFWQSMLNDYFGIVFSAEAEHLLALPHGLNASWRPLLRAVPLFLWLLAEAVPYCSSFVTSRNEGGTGERGTLDESVFTHEVKAVEAEVNCFVSIARHIADILYGLAVPDDKHLNIANASILDSTTALGNSSNCVSKVLLPDTCSNNSTPCTADITDRGDGNFDKNTDSFIDRLTDAIRFGLFPCMRNKKLFKAPADFLTNGCIQSVVTVETLYKVFERC